jgi:predicted MFS family arabinose efflux permease
MLAPQDVRKEFRPRQSRLYFWWKPASLQRRPGGVKTLLKGGVLTIADEGRMPKEEIWTRTFNLLCIVQFLSYANHFLVVPIFDQYVLDLGGSHFTTGLLMSGFAISGIITRPLMGYYADRFKESQILSAGVLIQSLGTALCGIPNILSAGVGQITRGIGWSGSNVGGYAIIPLATPASRSGEASGYYSASQQLAVVLLSPLGFWIYKNFGAGFVFGISAAAAFAGWLAALFVQYEKISRKSAFSLFEKRMLLIFVLQCLLNFSVLTMVAFIHPYSLQKGIANVWLFFTISGLTSIVARPLLGRLSDKIGRWKSLAIAFSLQIIAFSLLGLVSTLIGLVLIGLVYSLAQSIGNATTLAVARKKAEGPNPGSAMGTYSIAYTISSAAGSFVAGSIINSLGFEATFATMAGVACLALYLTVNKRAQL